MVGWMEENQELLQGKQTAWFKDVKQQEFSNDEHITVKRIADKVTNMKRAWKGAKALQERSRWGLTREKNEASVNGTLEKKCAFFWRLDEIWGARPNVAVPTAIRSAAATAPRRIPQSHGAPPTPSQSQPSLSQPPAPPTASAAPTASAPPAAPAAPAASAAPAPTAPQSLDESDDDNISEWQLSPPTASPPAPSPLKPSSTRSTLAPVSTLRSISGSRAKRDWGTMFKQALEERTSAKSEAELKRRKAELDIRREEIEIKKERIASQERMVKLQTEAQIKQAESFARVMEKMVDILGGASGGSASGGSAGGGGAAGGGGCGRCRG